MAHEDIEAIKQVKFAYFRYLDLKQFEELGRLLTEDVTAAYEDGKRSYEGRAAVVTFLGAALGDPGIVSHHNGHHPEIELTGPDSATGVWYLHDRVIVPAADIEIGGTAFYRDEYARVDGRWLIARTGYQRVFEERRRHRTLEVLSFTSRF